LSQNTRDSDLSYNENRKSLFYLVSKRYQVVTDGQTDGHQDRITVANTHYMLALARKNALLWTRNWCLH